ELGVVDERFGSKSKVHEDSAGLGATTRLDMHGQTELADKRAAWRPVLADAPAEVLDRDPFLRSARSHCKLIAVNYHPHGQCIDFRNRPGIRLGSHRLGVAEQRREHAGQYACAAATKHISPTDHRAEARSRIAPAQAAFCVKAACRSLSYCP